MQGTVVEVGTVASETKGAEAENGGGSPGESGSETTIPVTLALRHPVPHLDQAPVSVELVKGVRQERARRSRHRADRHRRRSTMRSRSSKLAGGCS